METKQLSQVINDFGFKLFKSISEDPSRSAALSPLSIVFALMMLFSGAKASTRDGIISCLGLSPDFVDDALDGVEDLIEEFAAADDSVVLNVASAIFAKEGLSLEKAFVETCLSRFAALSETCDFKGDPDGAVARINRWCDENTNHKITSIIDEVTPETALFILNAVYFKGIWSQAFDSDMTSDRTFTDSRGNESLVATMYQSGNYLYSEDEKIQALSIPYGKGRFSMGLFLPRESSSLADFITSLTDKDWNDLLNKLQYRDGVVYLPKFKFDSFFKLNEVLKSMGMEDAFNDEVADFSGIVAPPEALAVDEVRHKTYIEVNEEFTEAAAVTAIGVVSITSVRVPEPPFLFDANRPFAFAIFDNSTGAIAFFGTVSEF